MWRNSSLADMASLGFIYVLGAIGVLGVGVVASALLSGHSGPIEGMVPLLIIYLSLHINAFFAYSIVRLLAPKSWRLPIFAALAAGGLVMALIIYPPVIGDGIYILIIYFASILFNTVVIWRLTWLRDAKGRKSTG